MSHLTLLLLFWGVLTVSLFNLILLLWLALMVLLNAERRRSPGIWLAGSGLLMGEAFFICHTVIFGGNLVNFNPQINLWWQPVWLSVTAAPFAWYLAMLWYAGFHFNRHTPLARRHLPWLGVTVLLLLGMLGLLHVTHAQTFAFQRLQLSLSVHPAVAGMPLTVLLYLLFSLLCIVLSLDALRHPGAPSRMMGELARRRALPWLTGASLVLLLVSLLVAALMCWAVWLCRRHPLNIDTLNFAIVFGLIDLTVITLVGVAVVCIGQAIVAYEIFTGMSLPMRALLVQWRRTLLLAGAFSTLVSADLVIHDPAIYVLLLATIVMVFFIALAGRRSYIERERAIETLRPFIASPRIYDALLAGSLTPEANAATAFRALVTEVLGARSAVLVALGSFSPLAGAPLAYPEDGPALPPLEELLARCDAPQMLCFAIDPARYGGRTWAVPLWSEQRLIGLLLLGEKEDGGLYTQEEMEIARAGGERLLDLRAGANIAQRLMALQRQRLTETRLVDHRTRRLLHDDILPRLHTAMLTLSAGDQDGLTQLADVHRQISNLLREMPATEPEVTRLGLLGALRQVVEVEHAGAFDAVDWQVLPEAETATATLPPLAAEVLFYAAREAIRNAARYGRGDDPARPLHLRLTATLATRLCLRIEDTGIGTAAHHPSTGSGHGLALHGTMMAVVGGELIVESAPGQYTRVVLTVPVAAAVAS